PLGSMGTDTALAVLSDKPRPLYDYFKQLFAQVTNPPLDQIREELVTSMESTVGPERNLLAPEPESCRQINLNDPVLSNEDVAKLRHVAHPWFKSTTLPMLFEIADGAPGLERAIEDLQHRASEAIAAGHNVIILSDRGVTRERAAIPSLLATAAVHHHLVRGGERTRCGLVIDVIAEEVRLRHERAFPTRPVGEAELDWGGEYQWRRDGEYHLFNPDTVFKLQHATRAGQYTVYREYTKLVDDQSRRLATLRGLIELQPAA